MAQCSTQHWRSFYILFSLTVLTVFKTECSPVQESPEKDNTGTFCPKGWYHYKNFCMTRGSGGSEKAVAFYCDGFGGIGIKGLCITSIKHPRPPSEPTASSDGSDNTQVNRRALLKLSLGLHRKRPDLSDARRHSSNDQPMGDGQSLTEPLVPTGDTALVDGASDIMYDEDAIEARVCPVGWTHYQRMCIYKPWTAGEACHLFRAIEFNGLCIKHADMDGLSSSEYQMYYKLGKRVCCCNHVASRDNHYAC